MEMNTIHSQEILLTNICSKIMIRTLHIGEKVYDDFNAKWGYIEVIGGQDKDTEINFEEDSEVVITLMDEPKFEDSYSHWEVFARDIYPIAKGKRYKGHLVCYEHDRFLSKYPYFCPDEYCNLEEEELDKSFLQK